jgi:divalent metal cation (Fe/Co/Zn/Cd) transporter
LIHAYNHRPSIWSHPPSRRASFDEESALLHEDVGDDQETRIVNIAIFVNFAANVFLLIAKLIVTLTSSSLSVLASLVDSVLDFLSTMIIYSVSRIVQRRDWKSQYDFPVGKARLEPIGVLVFSVVMIVSFIQVGVEAVQRLFKSEHKVVALSIPGILIMSSTG